MSKYSKQAAENFKTGYNCAQSVLLTFAKEVGLDKDTALKLSSSFGGGMGRLREVCGAVSAMFMIAGLLKGYTAPNNDEIKGNHYATIQTLAEEFESKFGSIICRKLLNLECEKDSPEPSKRTEQYYKERPCEDFIAFAAEIIETKILNQRSKSLEEQVK